MNENDIKLIQSRQIPAPDTAVRLYALNAEVDRLNRFKYAKLDESTEHTYDWNYLGEKIKQELMHLRGILSLRKS